MFIDEARITVKGGDGGQGCESYYKDKYMRFRKPDGGDGGKGGDVSIIADRGIQTLLDYKYKRHYKAQKGGNASSKGKKGKDGRLCILKVPVGTIIKDHKTGLIIKDLFEDQQAVTIAKGGEGGLGNARRKTLTLPSQGEEKIIDLELKLVADVGIIGFPNAGKSTLISSISKVQSKIANYPFTTKQPVLGIVSLDDFNFIVADLPGIIEGAHQGRGLGDRFLRHAERTKILLHVLDMAATEGRDPLDDYHMLNQEILAYSENLSFKNKLIVANKMDLAEANAHLKRFKEKYKTEVIPISALDKVGIDHLVNRIKERLCQENFQGQ